MREAAQQTRKKEISLRYRLLGNSGLRVSEAALGAMTFGDEWGWALRANISETGLVLLINEE
jgi:hypothetical protein